jgi:hypothetical protein
MIAVIKEGILLTKTALGFENEGVLNPASISDGGFVHLFYRAVAEGNFSSIGYCKLRGPITQAGESVVISGAYLLHSEFVFKKGTDPMAGHKM